MFLVTISHLQPIILISVSHESFPHVYNFVILRMFYKWNHTVCDFLRLAFFTQHKYPEDQSMFSCVSVVHPLYCGVMFCSALYHTLAIHSLKDI